MVKRAIVFVILVAARAVANDLAVNTRTLQMNDIATITVSVEGSFAAVDAVNIPLQNLAFVGEGSASSEFAWINGQVTRRKVFRHQVRPLAPGAALVGPVVLTSPDGQRETLAPVALIVQPDRASGSNDAEVVLRELLAMGRDPLFVVAEAERTSAYVGEPLVVTWYLYNAATVQQWHVVSIPKLDDFWTEDIPVRSETPERAFVGSALMQRVPIRRVVLYPLRSGSHRVTGLTVEAAIMRRIRTGPFAMFEGELVETTFTSAPIEIAVKPLPRGPPVDAVGALTLTCEGPRQQNNGPVVIAATLAGIGNVRAAAAPRFAGPVAGNVQIEGGRVEVTREEANVTMSRSWWYLVFPSRSGTMRVPELTIGVFAPSTAERKELRCEAKTLDVVQRRPPAGPPPTDRRDAGAARSLNTPLLLGGLAGIFALLMIPPVLRELRIRRDVRTIIQGGDIRASVDARLNVDPAKLIVEKSDRGEAYRALRSLLDAAERERDLAVTEAELRRRVRDVLTIAR